MNRAQQAGIDSVIKICENRIRAIDTASYSSHRQVEKNLLEQIVKNLKEIK